MCLRCLVFAAWSLGAVFAQQDPDTVRRLVEEGALPKDRLRELDEAAKEIQDTAILERFLYGQVTVQDLTEAQAGEMVAAAKRLYEHEAARLEEAKRLVKEGVAPRNSLVEMEMELIRRQQTVWLAEARQKLLLELAEMARAEQEIELDPRTFLEDRSSVAIRFDGDGSFSHLDWKRIVLAYEKRFNRSLPVTANGETHLHRSMGLDHRGRIDVGLNPDQDEGVWLRRFLESEKIPYFAFRRQVRGKSTAPHIHVGPPSLRLRAAD